MHNFPILYVEDEEFDVLFLKQAFSRAAITNSLQVATNGRQAMEYLAGEGIFANRDQYPFPGLILLDLNLPYKSGFEVLKWIRTHPRLKTLLVVIFTASDQPRDLQTAYELGANGYLVKPIAEDFDPLVHDFMQYWLVRNEPPPSTFPPDILQPLGESMA